MSDKNTALAKTDGGLITSIANFNRTIAELTGKANLLIPATQMTDIPLGFGMGINQVMIPANDKKLCYPIAGDFALGKTALAMLCQAAKISILEIVQEDDGSDPHHRRIRAKIGMRGFDGVPIVSVASKDLDLRDGSPTVEGLHERAKKSQRGSADNQIREMRMFINEHAESKAINRAIRQILAIKSTYTAAELAKPFVCLYLTFDTANPEVRKALLAANLGAVASIYGGPSLMERKPRLVEAAIEVDEQGEVIEHDAPLALQAQNEQPTAPAPQPQPAKEPEKTAATPSINARITDEQKAKIESACLDAAISFQALLESAGFASIDAASMDDLPKIRATFAEMKAAADRAGF
jgi:hypothetical protein